MMPPEDSAMPLRDHFRPPLDAKRSWDELHGMWPAVIVQYLFARLPSGYVAAPGVHLSTAFEIDIATFETDDSPPFSHANGEGGVATATWAPPAPTLTLEADLPDQDEYEVRVYDETRGRHLVAAIEIVSPSNKDRPESRKTFIAKVTALLQQGVCVSVVDPVSVKQFNLYAELLEFLGPADPALGAEPPHLYAVTLRRRKRAKRRPLLESWFYPMELGRPLPTLPIWLDGALGVSLELEPTYEDTCRFLRIA
jgi:hypothetical protein